MTTLLEEEIRSQGDILRRRTSEGRVEALAAADVLRAAEYFVVAARGSSDNAAVFFQYFAGQHLSRLVALATPSLYEAGCPIDLSGAGVVAISQSGRTPGLLDVVRAAQSQGRPSVVLTNRPESPLGAATSTTIALRAGEEKSLAATKTFSTTWHALAQLTEALAGYALDGLAELPDLTQEVARWALESDLPIDLINAPRGLSVIGRGVGQAVAAEIALKIREVAGIRAESFSAADYLHGPVGADGDGATLILVLSDELPDDVARTILDESRRFSMRSIVLCPPGRAGLTCDAEIQLEIVAPNWCLALAHVVVGQVLALRVGQLRGRPIDTSPGLSKVTLSA